MVLDLAGEVGDQLGSHCEILAPHGMIMKCFRNTEEPGQRTWIGRRELWEPPVEDGGHVACGFEVASAAGCQHVAEWVLSSFGREGEQVGSQGRPGGFVGEPGDVPVGLVELRDGLGSNELLEIIKKPKTEAARRTIALPMWLVPELEQHFAEYSELLPDGRVFVGPSGITPSRPNFSAVWARALKKAGLSGVHVHDLRHTGNHFAATSGASTGS